MINCIKIETSSAFRPSQPVFSPHHYNRLHRTLAKNCKDTFSSSFCPHEIQRFTCGQEHKKLATHDNAGLLALSGPRNPYPSRLGVVAEGALADLIVVDGNPLADLALVADPEQNFLVIMKDGVIYKNTLTGN